MNLGNNKSLFTHAQPASALGSIRGSGSNLPASTNSVNSGGSKKTWGAAYSAWGDFNAVQLVFANHTATPSLINNHCVAVGTTAYPGGVFNISAPSGGWGTPQGPVTAPVGTSKQPGLILGPKITIHSLPRADGELDGGKYPLLFIRNFTDIGNATTAYGDLGANFPTIYDPDNEGFSVLTASPSFGADNVTTPSGWLTSTRETTPGILTYGVVFSYDQKLSSVIGIGDSVIDGSPNRTSFTFKACARLRKNGKKISFTNGGISGSTMAQINAHGKDMLTAFSPEVIVLASYTINSPIATQTDWDNQWALAIDLAQTQLALGKKVILLTPLPIDSMTTTQNGFRNIQRNRVINSGIPYVDVESLANSVGKWANPAFTIDGTHPTSAGNNAISDLLQPILETQV